MAKRRQRRNGGGKREVKKAQTKLWAALDVASRQLWPYLSEALRACTPVCKPGIGTVGIDQYWRLYWDPAAVEAWTVEQLAVVMLHEVSHPLRRHHQRAQVLKADPQLANICMDAEINDDLDEETSWPVRFALPPGAVLPEAFDLERGKLWEEYYHELCQQLEDESECPACGGSGKSGDDTSDDTGSGDGDSDDTDSDGDDGDSDGAGSGDSDSESDDGEAGGSGSGDDSDSDDGSDAGNGGSGDGDSDTDGDDGTGGSGGDSDADSDCPVCGGSGRRGDDDGGEPGDLRERVRARGKGGWHGKGEGSGAGPEPAPWEEPPPSPEGSLPSQDDSEVPGLTEAEADALRRVTAQRIEEHVRARGTVPAGWRRFAAEQLETPKIPWERQLNAAVRGCCQQVAGAVDYTYARPGRRSSAFPGIAMPALRRPLPRVHVLIDTSGSMSDDMITKALSETQGVCRAAGADITVSCCDAGVHGHQRVVNAKAIQVHGGGGTDMRVGIEAALKQRPRPDVIVVLTDGYTPWPSAALPRTKLVVGLIGDCDDSSVPAWAHTVRIDVHEREAA